MAARALMRQPVCLRKDSVLFQASSSMRTPVTTSVGTRAWHSWASASAPRNPVLQSPAVPKGLMPALPSTCMHASSSCAQRLAAKSATEPVTVDRGPMAIYEKNIREGTFREDSRQRVAVALLQELYIKLEALYPKKARPSNLTLVDNVATSRSRQSWCAHGFPRAHSVYWFIEKWSAVLAATSPHLGHSQTGENPDRPLGIYFWGGVGVGKTVLMDLFVGTCPREFYVHRTHFHDFMLSVHKRLRHFSGEQDPLRKVADIIATETCVLCLDELFVTNVADAVILERLFGRLWDRGVTLVATSNRHPNALYEGGLQRQLFLPFVWRLERECVVHDMDSPTDHRMLATRTIGVYFVRLLEGCTNDDRLASAFRKATDGRNPESTSIVVAMGRKLHVPAAVGPACQFTFDELCGANVAAADYIGLANKFHTVALFGVPVITSGNRNSAYRFVTLVDVLYEHRVKFMVSAETYAGELFQNVFTHQEAAALGDRLPETAVVDENLGFAKNRTVSRLAEMQTLEYALAHAQRHEPQLLLALKEAKGKLAATAE